MIYLWFGLPWNVLVFAERQGFASSGCCWSLHLHYLRTDILSHGVVDSLNLLARFSRGKLRQNISRKTLELLHFFRTWADSVGEHNPHENYSYLPINTGVDSVGLEGWLDFTCFVDWYDSVMWVFDILWILTQNFDQVLWSYAELLIQMMHCCFL